jgi:hypothetical protein
VSFVSNRVVRLLLLLLLAAPLAAEESHLGSLIRWYLAETSAARREDYLEAIERLTGHDAARVAAAIRRGEHFRHPSKPELERGGAPPRFNLQRPRIQPIESPGDFAELLLPEGYHAARPYPLILELGRTRLRVPRRTVLARIDTAGHEQARTHAWAAEALVLSLLAELMERVHVDPNRVVLRAEGALAALAWYIALHNPDRFAGVLGARGLWPGGAVLAPNARWFRGLCIERRRGDPHAAPFVTSLQRFNPDHVLLRAPPDAAHDRKLLPDIDAWWEQSRRGSNPGAITLVADRGTSVRAYWITMVPLLRSLRKDSVGRHWKHDALARPATLTAQLRPDNLVEVKTDRVNTFILHVDPQVFPHFQPVRVAINGGAPVSQLVYYEIADLLEDYRLRRDPGLLYCCDLVFHVP